MGLLPKSRAAGEWKSGFRTRSFGAKVNGLGHRVLQARRQPGAKQCSRAGRLADRTEEAASLMAGVVIGAGHKTPGLYPNFVTLRGRRITFMGFAFLLHPIFVIEPGHWVGQLTYRAEAQKSLIRPVSLCCQALRPCRRLGERP